MLACQWSPTTNSFVSVSSDSTARIWNIPTTACSRATVVDAPQILEHANPAAKARDVASLDWAKDGSLLATGCYDGIARIFSPATGQLLASLARHRAPIFAVRWNRKG